MERVYVKAEPGGVVLVSLGPFFLYSLVSNLVRRFGCLCAGPHDVFLVERLELFDFVGCLFLHHEHQLLVRTVKKSLLAPSGPDVVALSRLHVNFNAALITLRLDDGVADGPMNRFPTSTYQVARHLPVSEKS